MTRRGPCLHWVARLFGGFNDLVVEKVERSAEDDPLDTVLVSFT